MNEVRSLGAHRLLEIVVNLPPFSLRQNKDVSLTSDFRFLMLGLILTADMVLV